MEKKNKLLHLIKQMQVEVETQIKAEQKAVEGKRKIVDLVKQTEALKRSDGKNVENGTQSFTMNMNRKLHKRLKSVSNFSNKSMHSICEEALTDWLKEMGFDDLNHQDKK